MHALAWTSQLVGLQSPVAIDGSNEVLTVSPLTEEVHQVMSAISTVIAVLGTLVITYGVLLAFLRLVRCDARMLRGQPMPGEHEALRHQLGYYLLLGLEILVAADIIETLIAPSLNHVALLAGIVIIRTLISYTLNWELSRQGAGEKTPSGYKPHDGDQSRKPHGEG